MHVLFLTTNTEFLEPEGGKERLFLEGMVEAAEVLHIIVATPWRSNHTRQKLRENVWVYPTNTFPGFQFLKMLRIARFELYWQKEFRAHIIHSDDAGITAWAGLGLSWLYKRVWIVNIRTYRWGMPLWLFFTYAYRVCVFSDTTRLYLLSHLTKAWEKKLVIFPKIYDLDSLAQETTSVDIKTVYPDLNFIIITIAKLRRGRDLRLALITLKLLRANYSYSKAGMVIIGSGFAALLARIRTSLSGLSPWVHIEPPSDTLTSYIKTANMFLYLSKGRENEDMLIRAAAAHCPIIAVDDVLSRAVIEDGVNGSIVQYPTPGELAKLILSINQEGQREIFRVNSAMNLKQTVIASREQVAAALTDVWEYESVSEEEERLLEAEKGPYVNPHPIEPPPPNRLQRSWIEFKQVWKEMFPADK